jgi:hypothetical protein
MAEVPSLMRSKALGGCSLRGLSSAPELRVRPIFLPDYCLVEGTCPCCFRFVSASPWLWGEHIRSHHPAPCHDGAVAPRLAEWLPGAGCKLNRFLPICNRGSAGGRPPILSFDTVKTESGNISAPAGPDCPKQVRNDYFVIMCCKTLRQNVGKRRSIGKDSVQEALIASGDDIGLACAKRDAFWGLYPTLLAGRRRVGLDLLGCRLTSVVDALFLLCD